MGEPSDEKVLATAEPQPQLQPQTAVPASFTVRPVKKEVKENEVAKDADTHHFTLKGGDGTSLPIVADESTTTLRAGLDAQDPVLGTISQDGDNKVAEIVLHHHRQQQQQQQQQQQAGPSDPLVTKFLMEYQVLGDRRAAHNLIPTDDTPEADAAQFPFEGFRWRNEGSGWELQHSSAEGVVLAQGALNLGGSGVKGPEFGLTDEGVSRMGGGDDFRLLAGLTFLRVWDKVRRDMMPNKNDERAAYAATGAAMCCCTLM